MTAMVVRLRLAAEIDLSIAGLGDHIRLGGASAFLRGF